MVSPSFILEDAIEAISWSAIIIFSRMKLSIASQRSDLAFSSAVSISTSLMRSLSHRMAFRVDMESDRQEPRYSICGESRSVRFRGREVPGGVTYDSIIWILSAGSA